MIMVCNARAIYYELKTTAASCKLREEIKLSILGNVCDYLEVKIDELESWEILEKALDVKYSNQVDMLENCASDAIENYHGDYFDEKFDKELIGKFEYIWDDIMDGIGDVEYSEIVLNNKSYLNQI